MTLIDAAIEFAAYAHRNQARKGTNIPYINHPFAVGMVLQQVGCKEELIAAGILHDTLEDTDAKEEQLLKEFGPEVLEIVKGCSEPDKGASWEERKEHTLEYLKVAHWRSGRWLVLTNYITCVPSREIWRKWVKERGNDSIADAVVNSGTIPAWWRVSDLPTVFLYWMIFKIK